MILTQVRAHLYPDNVVDDPVHLLLGLYRDLSRLELDVAQLRSALTHLADDEILTTTEHLRSSREGVGHLHHTLDEVASEIGGAREAVAAAIRERRDSVPAIGGILGLYRDVAQAELDVSELTTTMEQVTASEALHRVPQLRHLAEVLSSIHQRLAADRGIMKQIEDRLERVILESG